jgi:hypothetical protein
MFGCIALALAGGQCSYTTAQTLQQTVVSITLGIANGLGSGICQTLAQLGNTVKSANLPLAVKNQLLQDIAILETALGCACTV